MVAWVAIAVHVAGAAAVGELADRVAHTLGVFRMACGSEITGMAAGAGTGICGRRIRHGLGIARMTGAAADIRAVLTWIGHAGMPEVHHIPVRIGVAAAAVATQVQMPRRYSDSREVVVTRGAGCHQVRVIDARRTPGECAVAGVAGLRGLNVRARHADGAHGVVAGGAGVRGDRRVIHACRSPGVGRVAAFAGGCRGQVPGRLAFRRDAVVAAAAGPAHLGVIHADDR